MRPRPFLSDQFLLLDFVICLVFGLEVTLEGAKSARGDARLGTGPCFVTELACETIDRVDVSELEVAVAF